MISSSLFGGREKANASEPSVERGLRAAEGEGIASATGEQEVGRRAV
jgi:hypothetical protein